MRQLLLNWGNEKPQTLDTFVVGANGELLQRLRALNHSVPAGLNERVVYLWGEAGAGKSHLLHALAALPNARYIPPDAKSDDFLLAPDIAIYLLDDCDKLTE